MKKKVKIQIKHWLNGSVLFEHESVDNTIATTLEEAFKSGANLSGANLRSADLSGADLSSADLSSAKNADLALAMTRILPDGEIIGYKKCRDNKIVKLRIPTEAKRSHAFGRKCRAEFAEVLEITKGSRQLKTAQSTYDSSFIYKVGETVKPIIPFSDDWQEECESGIHFYITKLEAENHV